MKHWKRTLLHRGFEWVNHRTGTGVVLQVTDNRWTARLSVVLLSGQNKCTSFFVEDGYDASLQKCLLYVWQALAPTDKSTFELEEALADLQRFVA